MDYKTCDKCCFDIIDNEGDIIEHYCIDNNLYAPLLDTTTNKLKQ